MSEPRTPVCEPAVLYRMSAGVATLTLNIPARLNPLTLELQRSLTDALTRAAADRSVGAVVVTGAGRAFCAGADLSGIEGVASKGRAQSRSVGAWMDQAMAEVSNPLIEALRKMPVPTLAAVNGPAAGGAVGLVLAADIVIAARSAYFMLPFVPKLGLVPDLGASWFLPRRIGQARATALALLGERLSAEQAAAWGLIWQCVDDAALAATAQEVATRLAALPAEAVLATREAFDAAERNDLPAQLAHEAAAQSRLADRPAFSEGVRAFVEKRAPRFDGR